MQRKKVFINMGFIDKTCVQGTCSTSGHKLWRRQPRRRSRTICMIIKKLSLCQKVLTVRYIWKEAIFLFCKQLSYWLIGCLASNMNIQPVFNQYKAMLYMCPEDQWSEFTEEAAKKAFMDYVHHYERMETISRSDLGKSKCN